jgi:hypothetical protein
VTMWSGTAPLPATRSTRVSRFILWMVRADLSMLLP